MKEQLYDLETVEPQKIPIKVCVVFYNIEICYQDCGEKKVFLQSINVLKCLVVALSMVNGLFSLLFDCDSAINMLYRTDIFGASLLLLELGCRRQVVMPYYLRILLHGL